jgi:hypothetical protein
MPANAQFDQGMLQRMLKATGFWDVQIKDLSENALLMLWLFFVVAYLSYLVISFLRLKAYFVNTVAAVQGYWGIKYHAWRYIAVTAVKPSNEIPGGVQKQRKHWLREALRLL